MSRAGELLTLRGASDGAALTGTMNLTADILQASVASVRIPKGAVLKVYGVRVSGAKGTINVNFKKTLAGGAVPISTIAFDPTVDSMIPIEKRKPIDVRGLTGEESISIGWVQGVAALTYAEIDVVISTPE